MADVPRILVLLWFPLRCLFQLQLLWSLLFYLATQSLVLHCPFSTEQSNLWKVPWTSTEGTCKSKQGRKSYPTSTSTIYKQHQCQKKAFDKMIANVGQALTGDREQMYHHSQGNN